MQPISSNLIGCHPWMHLPYHMQLLITISNFVFNYILNILIALDTKVDEVTKGDALLKCLLDELSFALPIQIVLIIYCLAKTKLK